jgi:peptidyl-tRNA hydrolase
MKRIKLNAAVNAAKAKTRDALQTVYDTLNHGQQKQIVKNNSVKELFEFYGVTYDL